MEEVQNHVTVYITELGQLEVFDENGDVNFLSMGELVDLLISLGYKVEDK